MTSFHLELSAQAVDMSPDAFESAFDAIADALYDCKGIDNADLAGDLSTQIAIFSMDVDAEDEVTALTIGLGAARTALHASGGATPGWEDNFAMLRQIIETAASSSERVPA
ncbi:hypothetical protein [Cryobacterium aureum]|uniref:hypothetical protein n=1 Tax=Cryobacterium aureum TaxID=995037 RepID=UPI000CF45265|nr:hypothetical protein [Cryobacterium aureum]